MSEAFTGRGTERIYTAEYGYEVPDLGTIETIETEFRTALEGWAMLGKYDKRQYDPWAVAYTKNADTPSRKESVMFHKWRGEEVVGLKIILRGDGEIVSGIRNKLKTFLVGVEGPNSCVIDEDDGTSVETYIFGTVMPPGTINESMSSLMRAVEITPILVPSPDVE